MRTPRARLLATAGLCALFVASRAPLLLHGFGSDDDAWRHALAALHTHLAGRYVPSRVPGFPVYEGLVALLFPLGSVATNAASVVAQLAATALLYRIAKRLGLAAPAWIAAAFGVAPSVWVHTSQTMDYALTTALLLAAYERLLKGRWTTCGVLLALAAGSRVSVAPLVVAGLAAAAYSRRSWRPALALGAAFAITLGLVFVPVLVAPEVRDLRGHLASHVGSHHLRAGEMAGHARAIVAFLFGKLGFIAMLAAALIGGFRPGRRSDGVAVVARGGALLFEGTGLLLAAVTYALVPYEPAYLLPVFPLALLLLGRVAERRTWAVACLLMASEVFVTPLLDIRRLTPGRLAVELGARATDARVTEALIAESPATPTVSVVGRVRLIRMVVAAPALERREPAWAPFEEPGVALWHPGRMVGYAGTLTAVQRDSLAAAGYHIREVATGPR